MNLSIFNFLFSLSANHTTASLAVFISYTFAYTLAISLIIGSLFSKNKMFNFSLFILTGFFSWISGDILKIIFHTARPFVELNITPLIYEYSFAFPSEHTAVFTALAVAGYFLNKYLGIFLGICALLIGISRIVIGVHYPIDIIGGAILGGVVGYLIVKLFKKI